MAATENIPGWVLAQGIHDLGIGFFAHLLNRKPALEMGTDAEPNADADADADTDNESLAAAAQMSAQKAIDCQTFIVSHFTKDVADIRQALRLLDGPITQEADVAIAAAYNEEDSRTVREFKSKINSAKLAYDTLTEQMRKAAKKNTQTFTRFALKDAEKTEKQAIELYAWARTFLPGATDGPVNMDKTAKLKMMPYIVAMAYAVRAKLDVYYVESTRVEQAERSQYLERSRNTVEQFMEVLEVAVRAMLDGSSLLELALDYHLMMVTYVTLKAALQASVQLILESEDVPETTVLWDDGLAGIRDLFCQTTPSSPATSTTIPLDDNSRKRWWRMFTNETQDKLAIGNKIQLRDLCFVLGAAPDQVDTIAATFHLGPDYKTILFELPSAHTLRATLHEKLAPALNGGKAISLESVACIQNASDIPAPPVPAAAPANAIVAGDPASASVSASASASASVVVATAAANAPTLVLGRLALYMRWCCWAAPEASASSSPNLALIHRPARTFTGHSSAVSGVTVCMDGDRVASSSYDGTAKVWSLSTGQLLGTFTNSSNKDLNCIALFSDGKRAVVGGDDYVVRIWSIDSGTEMRAFKGHTKLVLDVAVSPDDCIMASASGDETIKLWNVFSGQCDATLTGHIGGVWCVAFSADGKTLASGSRDSTIKIWSVTNRSLERTITGHTAAVTGVTFDGERLLSNSTDETIKMWKWETGELVTTFALHTKAVSCVAVFPDGQRLASGSLDKTVRIWNVRSGMCEHTLTGHTNAVTSVAVSHDGRMLLSGSLDKSVKAWRLPE